MPRPEQWRRRVRPELCEHREAGGQDDHCPEHEHPVSARPGDDLTRRGRAEDDAAEQRQHLVAGDRGRRAADDLEPARQEHRRREEPGRGQEHRPDRDRERAVAEQPERDDRLGCSKLGRHECGEDERAETDQATDRGVRPLGGLLVRQPDQDRHEGRGEQRRAAVVDSRYARMELRLRVRR
jgi:hypothetical protein